MCILFMSTSSCPKEDKYKLILAANRDENYSRPSKKAHFWLPDSNIVAGQDIEPGKEGGTWLGMNRQGKIGALLNMPPKPNTVRSQKLGRGFLVTNFLQTNLTGSEYGNLLRRQNAADRYHSFNILTIDLNGSGTENGVDISYFSNYSPKLYSGDTSYIRGDLSKDHFQVNLNPDESHSFGNCLYNAPFRKVTDGQIKFQNLINTFDQTEEDQLVSGLINILKDSHRYYPDPAMQTLATARTEEFAEGISSRFVHIPWKNYGSRTHTIILVDRWNYVKYMEWTMEEPILDPMNATWAKTLLEFELEND